MRYIWIEPFELLYVEMKKDDLCSSESKILGGDLLRILLINVIFVHNIEGIIRNLLKTDSIYPNLDEIKQLRLFPEKLLSISGVSRKIVSRIYQVFLKKSRDISIFNRVCSTDKHCSKSKYFSRIQSIS